ncbi:MFS transporter [Paenibacillus albiflavus]|uniref:MFS transporter n=1 Tax=Paenibacillus albiflavus TaxID=2545760 RepID=UPI001F19C5C0|nr:MFS transporter [Paenibacillus albiflavus]
MNVLHVSIDVVSLITVIQMIVTMVAYYFWGNLNAKYSTRKVLYWTLPFIAIACLSWVGLLVLPVYAVLIMVHFFLGIGLGGFNQLVFNFIIGDTPKSERPMFIAVYSALTGFAAFLGPLVGGWLYGLVSDAPMWVQSFGIAVTAGAVLLMLAFTYGRIIFNIKQ